MKIRHASLLK